MCNVDQNTRTNVRLKAWSPRLQIYLKTNFVLKNNYLEMNVGKDNYK